jgi:hypothetical protein
VTGDDLKSRMHRPLVSLSRLPGAVYRDLRRQVR